MRTSEPRFRDSVISLSHTLTQLGLCVSKLPPNPPACARSRRTVRSAPRVATPEENVLRGLGEIFRSSVWCYALLYDIMC